MLMSTASVGSIGECILFAQSLGTHHDELESATVVVNIRLTWPCVDCRSVRISACCPSAHGQHRSLRPPAELDAHCRERLTSYKVPKTYEFIAELPGNEAGKIRRSALVAERESGWIEGMVAAR